MNHGPSGTGPRSASYTQADTRHHVVASSCAWPPSGQPKYATDFSGNLLGFPGVRPQLAQSRKRVLHRREARLHND